MSTDTIIKAAIGPRQYVYRNEHQSVYKVSVKYSGHEKQIFVTDYGPRVGVIVIGPSGVLLTRQYRHLVDQVSWEIPGGKLESNESAEEGAKRECMEETGVQCQDLAPLLKFQPGLDTLSNPTDIFYCNNFVDGSDSTNVANEEVCGHEWISLEECISMVHSGKILDSLSIIGLLSYNTFIRRK